jgi:hypothetical protein
MLLYCTEEERKIYRKSNNNITRFYAFMTSIVQTAGRLRRQVEKAHSSSWFHGGRTREEIILWGDVCK